MSSDESRALSPASLPIRTATWTATELPHEGATVEVPVVDPRLYRIVGEVARGGVGRILEAVDNRLQREVALKELLHPERNQARFIREAVLTARLQHPGIVAVHEVGMFSQGGPFIAMKLVRGESLREVIRKRATLAARMELLSAVLAVADAVAYAHSQHVIHRDLKPSNVLLGKFGEVVVVDWGLAKHLDVPDDERGSAPLGGSGDATEVGAVIGTPAYMPPEQALGRPVDERADVYALGALLYEVLTGVAPFSGASANAVLQQLLTTRPAPVSELAPTVPLDLAIIVDKAMQHEPSQRYRDAAELAADLRRFQLGQLLSVPHPAEAENDPAIEAAFEEELTDRTLSALRTTAVLALVLVALFAIPPRIYFGSFQLRDMVPRATAFSTLALILAATYRGVGRRHSQILSMLLLFVTGFAGLVAHVLQGGVLDTVFVGSALLIYLGGIALLPITPKRTGMVLSALALLSIVGCLAAGEPWLGGRFVTMCWLLSSGVIIGVVGAQRGYRIRRAEFYSRHRLQQANERLARLDHIGFKADLAKA
jgi:serine/threonine protein kinase